MLRTGSTAPTRPVVEGRSGNLITVSKIHPAWRDSMYELKHEPSGFIAPVARPFNFVHGLYSTFFVRNRKQKLHNNPVAIAVPAHATLRFRRSHLI